MSTGKLYVFDFNNYKDFLRHVAGGKIFRRGIKTKFAKAAECQSTYISQVLHGKSHLSLEQAERISRFLGHTKEETQFFLLLLNKDRSGSKELKAFFSQQIEDRITQRLSVVNRLGVNNVLTEEQHAIFYSSWQYLAIHMALTIPELQTREALANYFHITLERVDKVLEFLLQAGLAQTHKNTYKTGTPVIRLGKDSPHIFKHHGNWRQQAIDSAVVTLSKKDVIKLKDLLLEQLKENIQLIRQSPEEEVCVYSVDFFSLKKS
jgi:uncharacterized protein (TIGR02147 family)